MEEEEEEEEEEVEEVEEVEVDRVGKCIQSTEECIESESVKR